MPQSSQVASSRQRVIATIAPAAVPGAGGGQHHRVAAVRQQVRLRRRRRAASGCAAPPEGRARAPWPRSSLPPPWDARPPRRAACAPAGGARSPGRSARRGTAPASCRRGARRRWRPRHALVVRHEGPHDGELLALGQARRRVVERLVEAVAAASAPTRGEPGEIARRGPGSTIVASAVA